jgi:calcium-dependent protein kinase
MAMLDHPNVLSLHECFENAEYIYLVLELCTGGELLIKLNSQPHHHFSEAVACRYVRTIIECIAYLHEHSIVHRDLKLENFIFVDDSENSELKLIDFGLSKHFDTAEVIHGAVGTPFYVAPEVLTNCYSPKCDVWSIGVIAFMLLAGYPPFDGEDDRHTLHLVRTQPVKFEHRNFKTVSPEAIEFIRACLNRNVEERPEAKDLMSFPWIAPEARRRPSCALTPQVLSALHGFCRQRRFVKISLEVIAHTLTNEQVSVLRKQFSEFDIRHQGTYSK